MSSWTYSLKPLSAVELASDRQIRRNASQSNSTLRVTAVLVAALQRGTRVIEGCAAAAPETL
jgi:hypothetical protein